jgi:alpha-tubulin suppressor-like RCC1 family protein
MHLRCHATRAMTIAISAALAVPAGAAVAAASPAAARTSHPAAGAGHPARPAGLAVRHSAAQPGTRVSAGTLRGWGDGFGGVGDGTRKQRNRPVVVKLPAGVNVSSVRSACNHSLAVTTTGGVLAWGSNEFGQLGDGTTNITLKPVAVSLPPGVTVTSVRAGCQFSLALTSTGHLLAWGRDNVGQLGDGNTGDNFNSDVPIPVSVPPGTRAKAISIGEADAFALTSTGHLLAWGFNSVGQLGVGKKATVEATPLQVPLPAGTEVKSIAAGSDFGFALTTNSALFAWGANDTGELGNGSTRSRRAPVRVRFHLRGKPVGRITSLVAGCAHTLALTSSGAVLAWGFNRDGELGTGNTARHHAPVRVDLPRGTRARSISAGCTFSMALTTSGHVLTWGSGKAGQLGIGSTSRRIRPARVSFASGLMVAGIGAGPDSTNGFAIVFRPCAGPNRSSCHPATVAARARPEPGVATATAGTLRGWGSNTSGALGDGKKESFRATAGPVRLPGGTKVTSVRSQCSHSLAVTSAGGVLAWGANNQGQLGIGTTQSHRTPVRVHLPAGTKVSAVRAGCNFSLALTTSGHVLAWGFNSNGELGIGTTQGHRTPVQVHLPKGTRVTAISAGDDHSLALTSTGRVFSWGSNHEGQLGDTTTTSRHKPVPVALPKGTKVKALAAGTVFSFALTSKSALYAWGADGASELGDGQITNKPTPEQIVFEFRGTGPGAITALAAGCGQTLAITTKGAVLAWGDNSAGQLGDGTTTNRTLPVFAKLPAGTIPRSVSAGCTNSYALTSTGRVYAWGSNGEGELGDGMNAGSDVPVRVVLGAGFKAAAIGSGPDSESAFAVVTR